MTIQLVPDSASGWLPSQAGPCMLLEFAGSPPPVHLEHYWASAFLWAEDDVRSFMAAADEIAQCAMPPARSAEVIAAAAGMEAT